MVRPLAILLMLFALASGSTAQAPPKSELPPRLVTIQEKAVPLTQVLKKLRDQSGVDVLPPPGQDPKLDLDLNRIPFWQALDRIAARANLRLSLYREDGKIALVQGPHLVQPVSYHGPFRVALTGLRTDRRFDTGLHTCVARLEVAWPPPFQAFLVETRPGRFLVEDDKGQRKPMPAGGRGWDFIKNRTAWEMEVPLPAMPRAVQNLGLLKGQLAMIGSARMLTFSFDSLAKGNATPQDGVKVSLREFTTRKAPEQHWTFVIALEYPPGGPKLESFQNDWWLRRNEAYLVRKKGSLRFPNNGRSETDDQVALRPVITYRFLDEPEKKLLLGKPADWKLVYRTPSPLLEVAIPFEFRNVPLP